jgi:GTP cyclohydrolase II
MSLSLIVVFGPPGSGKNLVCSYLAAQLGCQHLSWGALFRSPEFRRQHQEAFAVIDDESVSIPTRSELISSLMDASMAVLAGGNEEKASLVLEGYPRRIEEAKAFLSTIQRGGYVLDAIVRINPSLGLAHSRLKERVICQTCGDYYLPFDLKTNICPKDGSELTHLPVSIQEAGDDFRTYNREIAPVFEHLSRHAEAAFDVSGDDDKLTVFSNILTKIRQKVKSYARIYERHPSTPLKTWFGTFKLIPFQSKVDHTFHLAFVKGKVRDGDDVLVRVHSSCITGDIFCSKRCECGAQLVLALSRINSQGKGVLVYLYQEGRGIGIINKVRAYRLQRRGHDTVDANELLGLPVDMREYTAARDILSALRVKSVILLTNNPDKVQKLTDLGVVISGVEHIEVPPNAVNRRYLQTKKARMGHQLDHV